MRTNCQTYKSILPVIKFNIDTIVRLKSQPYQILKYVICKKLSNIFVLA